MPTFGFSAYLKLLSQNPRPQRSTIKSRLTPSTGGYDYHRSFRLRAERYVVGGESISDVIASTEEISKDAERASAVAALEKLSLWRTAHPGKTFEVFPVTVTSPNRLFKVHFEPNFSLDIAGRRTAIHIWNNATPRLSIRETYATLHSVMEEYATIDGSCDDVAVLSVKEEPALYRLSDVEDQSILASRLLRHVEQLIQEVSEELKHPPSRPEDRAPA